MSTATALQHDIDLLFGQFEEVLADRSGPGAVELVRRVRELARRRRDDDPEAETELNRCVTDLTVEEKTGLVRASTICFDLVNLAEDHQRVRVIRQREARLFPQARKESIRNAFERIAALGLSRGAVEALLGRFLIELVLTAHPTEAKRRCVRHKLRAIRGLMVTLSTPDLLPDERRRYMTRLKGQLEGLWQSDLLRPSRPTVMNEVERGQYVLGELWDVVPAIYRDFREALGAQFPEVDHRDPRFLTFASWIGGDRDGNPNVTWSVTAHTLDHLRRSAVELHLKECQRRQRALSISDRHAQIAPALREALASALERWPELELVLESISPVEVYRRWINVIEWRLERSRPRTPEGRGGYATGGELTDDVRLIRDSLIAGGAPNVAEAEVEDWLCQARVFGLHMASLDVRQESAYLHGVIAKVLGAGEGGADYAALDEPGRLALLKRTLFEPLGADPATLGAEVDETFGLFRLLVRTARDRGAEPLGQFVVSMTHNVSDLLAVVWLFHHAARLEGVDLQRLPMGVTPLFETIDDLRRAPGVLEAILKDPLFIEHLATRGMSQTVMVGYSDSTKDGGYLAANWWLYRAQAELHAVTERYGVRLTIFHGRGGSLGRGGGPAARGVLSLPHHVVDGSLRVTEQGEVLAERYDDPQIARRHLEQMAWATLLVTASPEQAVRDRWRGIMEQLADHAFAAYRDLVGSPGFIEYFIASTPIEWIEQMPIASRPSRRSGKRSLSDLRAIPWVFAWTQSRAMIPAWYGLGTAIEAFAGVRDEDWGELRSMYEHWSFFRATVDNAELALSKADPGIARAYAKLVPGPTREAIWAKLDGEYRRSEEAVRRLTGEPTLLANVPWLQDSLRQRNPMIDPLNFLQVRTIEQVRAQRDAGGAEADEDVAHLMRLTIQGIAAGMRTTG